MPYDHCDWRSKTDCNVLKMKGSNVFHCCHSIQAVLVAFGDLRLLAGS